MAEPDAAAVTDVSIRALSGVMMAAAFVIEPGVWPGFVAFAERTTGRDFTLSPQTMDTAIMVADAMRNALCASLGRDPGEPYPPRWPDA